MKLVGKVPVEPLDDERLTNIERNLVVHVSEMSQRPVRALNRWLAFAAVAAAVVVAGFVGWKLRGDGAVVAKSEPEQLVMKDGALHLPDADITGKDFTVSRSDKRVVVKMQKAGKLDLRVDHDPNRLFVVEAGKVQVEDVGTRFSVDWDGGDHVDVRVTEGEVRVKSGGKDTLLAQGDAWTIEFGKLTIVELDAKLAAKQTGTVVAAADPTQQPGDVPPTDDVPVTNDKNGGSAQGSNSGSAQGSGAKQKPDATNAKKALLKHPLEPPDDAGTDDPKQAIATYTKQIADMPEGEDKAMKLYSIAVMHHRLKNDASAKHFISGVLKRQGGPAYKAALWLNVRINCLKTFDDGCRIAAEKYLAKFETGLQAGVAQEILKDISRGQ